MRESRAKKIDRRFQPRMLSVTRRANSVERPPTVPKSTPKSASADTWRSLVQRSLSMEPGTASADTVVVYPGVRPTVTE